MARARSPGLFVALVAPSRVARMQPLTVEHAELAHLRAPPP